MISQKCAYFVPSSTHPLRYPFQANPIVCSLPSNKLSVPPICLSGNLSNFHCLSNSLEIGHLCIRLSEYVTILFPLSRCCKVLIFQPLPEMFIHSFITDNAQVGEGYEVVFLIFFTNYNIFTENNAITLGTNYSQILDILLRIPTMNQSIIRSSPLHFTISCALFSPSREEPTHFGNKLLPNS